MEAGQTPRYKDHTMATFPKWLDRRSRPHLARALAESTPEQDGKMSPFFPLIRDQQSLQNLLPTNNAAFEIVLREIMQLLDEQERESDRN